MTTLKKPFHREGREEHEEIHEDFLRVFQESFAASFLRGEADLFSVDSQVIKRPSTLAI